MFGIDKIINIASTKHQDFEDLFKDQQFPISKEDIEEVILKTNKVIYNPS